MGALSTNFWMQKVCWHHTAMFCLITSSKLSHNNLNFHWSWRWWDRIHAIFLNLFYFTLHSQSLPSLAILRNLSFHPGGRAKLLLLPNYISLLNQCLKSGPGASQRLALVSLWSLAANCHKAKVELAKHGLMKTLEEVACCSENTNGDNLAKTVSAIVRKIQWIQTVNLAPMLKIHKTFLEP